MGLILIQDRVINFEGILGTGHLLFYDIVLVSVFFFFLLENRTLIPRTIFDDLSPLLHQ